MTADEALIHAWKRLAPNADISRGFPTGFWPDVARVAVEIILSNNPDVELSFRPTMCVSGSYPVHAPSQPPRGTAAKTRAENTAALLALLQQSSYTDEGIQS